MPLNKPRPLPYASFFSSLSSNSMLTTGSAQILEDRSQRRLNSLQWRLMLVGRQYGTCSLRRDVWNYELGVRFLENLCVYAH